jgi:tRNA (adenine37-N6)-methyltransferase
MAEMTQHDATRPGEIEAPLPGRTDACVVFIGTIRTPFRTRDDCPRQGKPDGPLCRIELDDPWKPALKGIERFGRIEVLYWMHQARRDLILQSPKANGETFGTFALRSPVRPNPIATSMVELVAVEDGVLVVRGLDCVDGTPLVDLKPDRCAYTPLAPPNPGELTEASS